MEVTVLRPMRPNSDRLPVIGYGAIKLGIRITDAIVDVEGYVTSQEGLSVALSYQGILKLPAFLRPFQECGVPITTTISDNFALSLYNYRNEAFEPLRCGKPIDPKLCVRDKPRRGCGYITVQDNVRLNVREFDESVKKTRICWRQVSWATAVKQINDGLKDY